MSPARLFFTLIMAAAFGGLGWALLAPEHFRATIGLVAPVPTLQQVIDGGPVPCEGETAVFCKREAYQDFSRPGCVATIGPAIADSVGDADAFCGCLAGALFDRFTPRELFLGEMMATRPTLIQQQSELATRLEEAAAEVAFACGAPQDG